MSINNVGIINYLILVWNRAKVKSLGAKAARPSETYMEWRSHVILLILPFNSDVTTLV